MVLSCEVSVRRCRRNSQPARAFPDGWVLAASDHVGGDVHQFSAQIAYVVRLLHRKAQLFLVLLAYIPMDYGLVVFSYCLLVAKIGGERRDRVGRKVSDFSPLDKGPTMIMGPCPQGRLPPPRRYRYSSRRPPPHTCPALHNRQSCSSSHSLPARAARARRRSPTVGPTFGWHQWSSWSCHAPESN